jgi:hypothetical protein
MVCLCDAILSYFIQRLLQARRADKLLAQRLGLSQAAALGNNARTFHRPERLTQRRSDKINSMRGRRPVFVIHSRYFKYSTNWFVWRVT